MNPRNSKNNTMNYNIRDETDAEADATAITEVTIAAFSTLEISDQTEQFVIEALRAANALSLSLVAESLEQRKGQEMRSVIGHIAFSPLKISDGTQNCYGLGPVSVMPEFQRQSTDRRRLVTA